MSLPRLALDFDDVIFDFNGVSFSFLENRYGLRTSPDILQTPSTLLANHLGRKKLSPSESQAFYRGVDQFIESDSSRCRLIPSASEGIKALADMYELVILTARSQEVTHYISNALFQHNLLEYFYAVYGSTPEKIPKPVRAQELDAIALIDDLPSNLENCEALGIRGILFERPWSNCLHDARGNPIIHSGERVQNWEELTNLLLKENFRA